MFSLGNPLILGRNNKVGFIDIVKKIDFKLQGWKTKLIF